MSDRRRGNHRTDGQQSAGELLDKLRRRVSDATVGGSRRPDQSEFDVATAPSTDEQKLDVEEHEELITELREAPPEERRPILDEIIDRLAEPDEFEFLLTLTHVVERTSGDHDLYTDVLDYFETLLEEPRENGDRDPTFVRFVAFRALTIHSRRTQSVSEWGERHDAHGDHFTDWEHEPVYRFDESMYEYYTNEDENIRSARRRLEGLARYELRDNPGVCNAFVSCTLRACGKTDIHVTDEQLRDAAETIQRAVDLYRYPEYYRNWGRLLGEYGERTGDIELVEEGAKKIRQGMDKEESGNVEKLAEYRYYLTNVQYRKRIVEAESKITDLRGELESIDERAEEVAQTVRSETLQFLGFFAAIITFVVTSVQLTTELDSVAQIATVIPITTGSLVFSFSVFIFLLEDDPLESVWSLVAVWLVGGFLVGLGIGMPALLR